MSLIPGAVGTPMQVPDGILGIVNASNPAAGNIGECISTQVSATWSATSGQWGDPGGGNSITLSAGVWELSAMAFVGGTTSTAVQFGIGTSTGNVAPGSNGVNQLYTPIPTAAMAGCGCIAGYKVNISTPTTYYLKFNLAYTGTPPVSGIISAWRRA